MAASPLELPQLGTIAQQYMGGGAAPQNPLIPQMANPFQNAGRALPFSAIPPPPPPVGAPVAGSLASRALARVPGLTVTNPAAEGLLARYGFMQGGKAALGKIAGKAGPGLAVATWGPGLVNKLPVNQDARDIIGNTVAGFGLGAAAGAPFAGVGAIPGGIAGGAAGLAKGLAEHFWGDKKEAPKPEDLHSDAVNTLTLIRVRAGIPEELAKQVHAQFEAQWAIAKDDETRAAVAQQAAQSMASLAGQPAPPAQMTPKDILAMQALISQTMKPYADQAQVQGAFNSALYNELAGQSGSPAIAAMTRLRGAESETSGNRLAAAYMQQAQTLPLMYQLEQQRALAYQTPRSSPSTSANDFSALLAQAQAGG